MDPIYDERTQLSFYLREGNLDNKPDHVKFLKAFVRKDISGMKEFVATKSREEIEEIVELLNRLEIHSQSCVNNPRNIPPPPMQPYVMPQAPKPRSKL